jgi:hypothetical protein
MTTQASLIASRFGLSRLLVWAGCALVFASSPNANAQSTPAGADALNHSAAIAPAQNKSATPPKAAARPGWSKLTASQQQALKPLASSWETLSAGQQRKWLEISNNYPSLSPTDQAKMHGRMREWVALSTQERAQARLNFAKTSELSKELSPAEKRAKWDAYNSLPPEQKQKLAETGSQKPLGAAPAAHPVSKQKLANLPYTDKKSAPVAPKAEASQSLTGPAAIQAGVTSRESAEATAAH